MPRGGAFPRLLDQLARQEQALEVRYRRALQVNPDLDRSLVSFQANRHLPGHRWCRYKEGFSAGLVRYAFDRLGLPGGTVLDPFAGSGTTLFVASAAGVDSIGIELLPSSLEMIRARQSLVAAEPADIARRVAAFARSAAWRRPGPGVAFPHLRITRGAFSDHNEQALGRYLWEVQQLPDGALKTLLRFAALAILESISYTRKDGQYLRWDARSGRSVGKGSFCKGTIATFEDAITAKLGEIVADSQAETAPTGADPAQMRPGSIELLPGSCLDLLPALPDRCCSALMTSPPYCNRYDYTRTYALELAMLGVDESHIRALRQGMLSCTVEHREKAGLAAGASPGVYEQALSVVQSQPLLASILEYLEACRTGQVLNNPGIPRMIRNYFLEMAVVLFECARVLQPGAPAIMVNDNVRYQGAHVAVDLILSDVAEQAGFDVEQIWILRRGKGNSSQQMGRHGRSELRKCVYVWRRRGD